jgi:polysaccharide biosynthesis transport protein
MIETFNSDDDGRQSREPMPVPNLPLQIRSNAGPNAATALTLSDVVVTVRHWWWQCTALGLILSGLVCAGIWFTFKPIYEASAFLEIKELPLYVAFPSGANSTMFFNTQLQTLQSPVVLSKVSALPEVASLTEAREANSVDEWLERNLKVKLRGQSELCEIVFSAHDPVTSMKVANAVMESYLSLYRDISGLETNRIIDLLTQEKQKRESEVTTLQERVRALTKQTTGSNPLFVTGAQPTLLPADPLSQLEAKQTSSEFELAFHSAKLKALEEMPKTEQAKPELPTARIELAVESNEEIKQLKADVAALQAQLRAYEYVVAKADRDPNVTRIKKDLAQVERELAEKRAEIRPAIEKELLASVATGTHDSIADEVAKVKATIREEQLRKELLDKQVADQRRKLDVGSEASLELEFARSDLRRAEEVYQRISDRIMILKTEQKAPARATAIMKAIPPLSPREALPYKRFAAGAAGALCAPFALALLWERRTRRIANVKQLALETHLPVLGEITMLPERAMLPSSNANARLLEDRKLFEESVDSLRVALMQGADFAQLRTLAVTSAVSREGKTSLSFALAYSLARCTAERTLLIDGDLRDPDLHELCGTALNPGLAEVLSGECRVEDAIVQKSRRGVHLLPAGVLKTNPHRLLNGPEFKELLRRLSTYYRYIIIDAPPVLAASEACVIANRVDGTMLCAMRDLSRVDQLQLAQRKLVASGANMVGAIMSGVPIKTWARKYGSYNYITSRQSATAN